MDLSALQIVSVKRCEEAQFKELMHRRHLLEAPPKIGECAFYAASVDGQWVALSSFYTCAQKSSARDRWIGWVLFATLFRTNFPE